MSFTHTHAVRCSYEYGTLTRLIDGIKRNPEWARMLLWSYARNMAATAKKKNIFADVKSTQTVSDMTLKSYTDILRQLFVIRDIDAWTPKIRSKTAIRSAKKHILQIPPLDWQPLE